MKSGAVVALALCAAAMPPSLVLAARATAIAVPLEPRLAREAATVSYVVQSVLRQSPRVDYVDLAERAQGGAARERAAKGEAAKKVLEEGRLAFDGFEYDAAAAKFQEAIRLYEESDLSRDFAGLLQALALLGATHYFNGNLDAARQAMGRLLSLRPDYVFDATLFPPPVLELAEQVRAEVVAASNNPLEVQVRPVPARVYVDGVFRGISPVSLAKLAGVEHYVSAVAPGYAFAQEKHRAGPAAVAKITLKPAAEGRALAGLLRDLEKGFRAGQVHQQGAKLAQWAGVDEVIVGGISGGPGSKLEIVLARIASDGHVASIARGEVSLRDAAAMQTVAALAMKVASPPDLPRGPGGAPVFTALEVGGGFGAREWGYVSSGVGAALLLGGGFFALQASQAAARAKGTPQVEQSLIERRIADARSKALFADSLFAAGAVAAGVGIYLILPKGESAEIESEEEDPFALAPVPLSGGAGVVFVGSF